MLASYVDQSKQYFNKCTDDSRIEEPATVICKKEEQTIKEEQTNNNQSTPCMGVNTFGFFFFSNPIKKKNGNEPK